RRRTSDHAYQPALSHRHGAFDQLRGAVPFQWRNADGDAVVLRLDRRLAGRGPRAYLRADDDGHVLDVAHPDEKRGYADLQSHSKHRLGDRHFGRLYPAYAPYPDQPRANGGARHAVQSEPDPL